jgi:endonuclease/exonuclease/phosphatase family metal-dependent hydrolase
VTSGGSLGYLPIQRRIVVRRCDRVPGCSLFRSLTGWWLAVLALALLANGCATAVNYLDPTGPVYVDHYAAADSIASRRVPSDDHVRVVSFNIQFSIHINQAIEVLNKSDSLRDFDVLALQEMDAPGVEKIARELHLHYVYFPSAVHPNMERDFGCAILSPWPLEEPRKIVLPHGARISGLRRAAVVATVVRHGERFRCYAVHLPAPISVSGGDRREQVRMIIADTDASPYPVVVAGDFNSYDIGHEFAAAGFDWLTRDTGPTVKRFLLDFHYDHIFARNVRGGRVRGTAAVVKNNWGASDHKAIWADIEFETR